MENRPVAFESRPRSQLMVEPEMQKNVDAYCQQLHELLEKHEGKYVIFANERLVKVCDSYQAALEFGYGEFGRDRPFMLQRVRPLEVAI